MKIPNNLTITQEDIYEEVKKNFIPYFIPYLNNIYNKKNDRQFSWKIMRTKPDNFTLEGLIYYDKYGAQKINVVLYIDKYVELLSAGLLYEDSQFKSKLMRWNLDNAAGIKLVTIDNTNDDLAFVPNPLNWKNIVIIRLLFIVHCWLKAINIKLDKLTETEKYLLINSEQDFLKTDYWLSWDKVNTANTSGVTQFVNWLVTCTSGRSV